MFMSRIVRWTHYIWLIVNVMLIVGALYFAITFNFVSKHLREWLNLTKDTSLCEATYSSQIGNWVALYRTRSSSVLLSVILQFLLSVLFLTVQVLKWNALTCHVFPQDFAWLFLRITRWLDVPRRRRGIAGDSGQLQRRNVGLAGGSRQQRPVGNTCLTQRDTAEKAAVKLR